MRRQRVKVPNTHKLGSGGKPSRGALPALGKYDCFLGLDGEDERVMNVFRVTWGCTNIDKIQEEYKKINDTSIGLGTLKSTLTKLVAENKLKRTENRGQYFYERSN